MTEMKKQYTSPQNPSKSGGKTNQIHDQSGNSPFAKDHRDSHGVQPTDGCSGSGLFEGISENSNSTTPDTERLKIIDHIGIYISSKKLHNRVLVAFGLIILFHFIYPHPTLWSIFNILFPLFVMYEYGGIQRRMLNKIGLGHLQAVDARINDWRFLTNQLLNKICWRIESCVMLYVYHVVIMTLPPIKMIVVLGILLIFVMARKLSILDRFIREHKQIAFSYSSEPTKTTERYETMQQNNKRRQFLDDPRSDEKQGLSYAQGKVIQVPDRISSMQSLCDIIQDPDFSNHCLNIACLKVMLEIFGHVLISLCSSAGYIVYRENPKLILFGMHFSQWSDFGGLIFGSNLARALVGETKFMKTISSKKTIEGVFGAILLPLLASVAYWAMQHYIYPEQDYFINLPLADYLFLAFVTGWLSVTGDLTAAFLKRAAGIRESGRSLGEHGGFFDRLDSLLLNGPFYIWYCFEMKKLVASPGYSSHQIHFVQFLKLQMDPLK